MNSSAIKHLKRQRIFSASQIKDFANCKINFIYCSPFITTYSCQSVARSCTRYTLSFSAAKTKRKSIQFRREDVFCCYHTNVCIRLWCSSIVSICVLDTGLTNVVGVVVAYNTVGLHHAH